MIKKVTVLKKVTTRQMYHWVSSYSVISGYNKMFRWPTYEELCDFFEKLMDSENIGYILRLNYPNIKRDGDEFTYIYTEEKK